MRFAWSRDRGSDALWVVGSAIVLSLFWGQSAPIARTLVIAVALVVGMFATLQYRAARPPKPPTLEMA